MLLAFIGVPAFYWPGPGRAWPVMGFNFLIWLLIFLLGWKTFGPPLHP